ncbi:hypothetical protein C4565_01985 [Candidatus Parcubacteria bacterium]|nr:MAG: hypothetical protein C4565_01985 [Candidatus Parcubacteria bacterium]
MRLAKLFEWYLSEENKMATFDEYLKNILRQVDDSHTLLQNLKDKPGDLDIIRREIAKITGLFQATINKLKTNKLELSDYQHFLSPMKYFLENHDFFREMDMMSLLYSEDPMRLKHLRLTILDALDEKNLIEHIKNILRE